MGVPTIHPQPNKCKEGPQTYQVYCLGQEMSTTQAVLATSPPPPGRWADLLVRIAADFSMPGETGFTSLGSMGTCSSFMRETGAQQSRGKDTSTVTKWQGIDCLSLCPWRVRPSPSSTICFCSNRGFFQKIFASGEIRSGQRGDKHLLCWPGKGRESELPTLLGC